VKPGSTLSLISIAFDSQRDNPPRAISARQNAYHLCTKSCQTPVNGLHSIVNNALTAHDFSLTLKIESVKQDRSLTAS
jgi:hypothetical protein